MKKIIKLTESDLYRIVKKSSLNNYHKIIRSQPKEDPIKNLYQPHKKSLKTPIGK